MKGYTERVPFTVHKSNRLLELSMLGMDIHEDITLPSAYEMVLEILDLPVNLFSPMLIKKISNLIEINNHMLDWQKILSDKQVETLQSMINDYKENYESKNVGVFVDYMNEIRTTLTLYSTQETYLEPQKAKRTKIVQEDEYEEDDISFKFLADELLGNDSEQSDLEEKSDDNDLPDNDVVWGKVELEVK